MLTGLFPLPWWGYLCVILGLTHLTIASVTIFLHRSQTHRSVSLHPLPAHLMRFWLWLTTGMVTREWVAVHRKHHAHCDLDEDPHSPQVRGISKVLWQGAELYTEAQSNEEMLARYGKGTPDDWIERQLYSRHRFLGIGLMLLIDLACFGPLGLTIWAIQMLWIPFWAAGVINGIGHWVGYRNFECGDASRNISPLGLLIGGEELHNNHHAAPGSAKLSCRWFEFDIGWGYIRLLEMLGLARVRRAGMIQAPPKSLPADALPGRLQLLRLYGREVVLPTLKQECRSRSRSSRQLLRRARWLLLREKHRLNPAQRSRVDSTLSLSERLAVVCDYQERLRAIWQRSERSAGQLREALKEWCSEARASGVATLEQFADQLQNAVNGARTPVPVARS